MRLRKAAGLVASLLIGLMVAALAYVSVSNAVFPFRETLRSEGPIPERSAGGARKYVVNFYDGSGVVANASILIDRRNEDLHRLLVNVWPQEDTRLDSL